MSDTATIPADGTVPLNRIDMELARQFNDSKDDGASPLLKARLSNLVIYCNTNDHAETVMRAIPDIVAGHPAAVLLVVSEPGAETPLKATINVCADQRQSEELV